jgi:acetyltransferase-like isoleucine patch superfamily enzyme
MNTKFNKQEYILSRNRNILIRFFIKNLEIITRFTVPTSLRNLFYKIIGVNIGKNCFIGMDCILDSSFPELIDIQDNVTISFRVMIICHDDAKGIINTSSNRDDCSVAKVTLKKGCYIGAGAIILPGVIVGENAIVGAGSVVTKDINDNVTVAGVPARVIKKIGIIS